MKITRRATERSHGWLTVSELGNPEMEWDSDAGCIVVMQRRARTRSGFASSSTHHYKVSVSLSELAQMLDAVSEKAAVNAPDKVSTALTTSLRSLLRIANVCSGVTLSS